MSFCHLRLNRIGNDSDHALYLVESPDFDSASQWAKIGRLHLNKTEATYAFIASDTWKNYNVVPPWVYGLSEEEQKKLFQNEYKDHRCGAWTMRIHHYAAQFLRENQYPEKHPLTNFR